jgi:hypothetical protein
MARLPREKLPRQVFYLAEMPHNEGGKVDLARLRAFAAGGMAAAGGIERG